MPQLLHFHNKNYYYYYYYFNGQYNTLRPKAFDDVHVQFLSNIDLGNV